ncbi:MAG: CBS domain-containing protein [Acidobacteriia bacterium]|nr:CBS domain-containing protein [Terriglobia bacterium]
MKVEEVMTPMPQCCGFDTNLAEATELLWNKDCGVLPVVEGGKLAGIITDRDICIALGTRRRFAEEISVRDVATREVQTCALQDDVHAAMAVMRRARVRRLPVVDQDGKVEGILALNDIVQAVDFNHGTITSEEVINTLKTISEYPKYDPDVPSNPASGRLKKSRLNEKGEKESIGSKGSKAIQAKKTGAWVARA